MLHAHNLYYSTNYGDGQFLGKQSRMISDRRSFGLFLFADAKRGKNPTQQIIRAERTGDL